MCGEGRLDNRPAQRVTGTGLGDGNPVHHFALGERRLIQFRPAHTRRHGARSQREHRGSARLVQVDGELRFLHTHAATSRSSRVLSQSETTRRLSDVISCPIASSR
jgi:hypothetical protein